MIKKILLALAAIVVLILLFAATKPATFAMERSIVINAPPEAIHPYLIDFHKWSAWSPWEKYDPGMKRTYEGPERGKGAIYSWEGNSAVGKGRMEVAEETPKQVDINLDFSAPMETNNKVRFVLTPQGSSTNVVWSMSGENNYLSKLMQVFVSLDSMMGPDFESGLADLKAAAEKPVTEKSAESIPQQPTPAPSAP